MAHGNNEKNSLKPKLSRTKPCAVLRAASYVIITSHVLLSHVYSLSSSRVAEFVSSLACALQIRHIISQVTTLLVKL